MSKYYKPNNSIILYLNSSFASAASLRRHTFQTTLHSNYVHEGVFLARPVAPCASLAQRKPPAPHLRTRSEAPRPASICHSILRLYPQKILRHEIQPGDSSLRSADDSSGTVWCACLLLLPVRPIVAGWANSITSPNLPAPDLPGSVSESRDLGAPGPRRAAASAGHVPLFGAWSRVGLVTSPANHVTRVTPPYLRGNRGDLKDDH